MRLQRVCQLIGCLLAAAIISIWVNSYYRFYQEHGRLPYGGEMSDDEVVIFPDEPRHAQAGSRRERAMIAAPQDIPETQFYWWVVAILIVLGLVLWKMSPTSEAPD